MNLFRYATSFSLVLSLLAGGIASARGKHAATGEIPKTPPKTGIDFIENKGQWVPEAKFKASIPGGVMFITDNGFVYNYMSETDLERIHEMSDNEKDISKEIVHHHAYKVSFAGANPTASYVNENKSVVYNNYFIGNNSAAWQTKVPMFGKVTRKNVYDNIDLVAYSKENAFKYDFVVAAGADPGKIALQFEGVQPVLTPEGHILLKTSVNEVMEHAPYTYQVINGKQVTVKSRYKLEKGTITFEFPEGYNEAYQLVIDPVLVFATYSGGTGTGSGFYSYSTTYDSQGNTYAGSGAYNAGWPVTLNAFQATFVSGQDVAVNKYNATGSALVYSTYYGGGGVDLPHAMIVNDQDELIVVGSTTSNNLALSASPYDATLGGATDIFVVHFNNTATGLIGATYMGGSQSDPAVYSFTGIGALTSQNTTSPVEVNFDNVGNIWVVSSTPSTDFPVSANANQAALSGGNDGVVFKLSPNCSQLLYSSFIGGTGNDAVFGIQFNNSGNVVICGATQSTNFPTTTGALQTVAPGGTFDGFVSILNSSTGVPLQSTYVGTDNTDQAVAIQVDGNNNILVLGRTLGTYPISTGVYSVAGGDLFIDKLNPTLSASIMSTRLGNQQTAGRYFPTAFLHDICGNTYVCGLAASAGLPLSTDAFLTSGPFWFGVLEPSFTGLLYGSYFGAGTDHTHVGVNRLDPQGIVYHSICNINQYPFTNANSYQPTKLNSGQDIVSFKFNFEATGVNSNFILDPTITQNDTGCAPYTVQFKNTSTSAKEYTWNFGDGSPTSNDTNVTHTFVNPGVYTVTLYANNDSSCITDDTAYMTITVLFTAPPDLGVNDTTICSFQQAVNISVDINNPSVNNTILWGPAAGILTAPDQPTITVDPSVNNVYWVTVKDTIPGICGFSKTDTVHIDLSPRVLDIYNNDTVVCEGASIPINAIGTPGYTYSWSPSVGVSNDTLLEPVITINQPNLYTLTASYPNCPDTSVQISFDMHYIPTLDLGPDKTACQWTEVALESTVTPYRSDYLYLWTPTTPNLTNPTGPNTSFITDTTITYTLQVQTPIGCSDMDTINILVYPGAFGAISADTGYCPGNEAPLWASGGASYTWSPAYGLSDTTIPNPVASPLTTTNYTVLIKDIHNCLDTERVSVQVYPEATLTLPDSITVYSGEQYHVEPGGNCLYFSWFPPSGLSNANISDPLMSPEVRTRYFVNATTENGCAISDSMDVLVKETVIDMPNAFSPSGSNKLFKPSKRGIATLKEFAIYNRWGNKVYSSTNIDAGWDGTKDGTALPMGVYVYVIEAVTDTGKVFTKQGNVTLIR